MRLKAKEMGFVNNRRVRPGEEFEMPDWERPGDWMEIITPPEEPQPWQAEAPRGPRAGSFDTLRAQVEAMEKRLGVLEVAILAMEHPSVVPQEESAPVDDSPGPGFLIDPPAPADFTPVGPGAAIDPADKGVPEQEPDSPAPKQRGRPRKRR